MAKDSRVAVKEKYSAIIKKNLTVKRVLLILIILVAFMIFSKALKGLILMVLFVPMAKYSVRIARYVNYITFETYTASTILMAYLYGPLVGALSGLFLGMYGYLSNSVTKFLAFTNVFVSAFTGAVVGYLSQGLFKTSTMPFTTVFITGILLCNAISFVVFLYVDSDQMQNISYRITGIFLNIFLYRILFELIYTLFKMI